jgi:hypothetical protein
MEEDQKMYADLRITVARSPEGGYHIVSERYTLRARLGTGQWDQWDRGGSISRGYAAIHGERLYQARQSRRRHPRRHLV